MAHEYNPFTWTDNGDGLADNISQARLLQIINNILMHAFVREGRWNDTYSSASCSDVLQLLSRC